MGGFFITVLAVIFLCFYFIPTIIAFRRDHDYRWIIFAINLCLGFTGIAWLVVLIWAIYPKDKSLADPILGNPTGIGRRNAGDTIGAVKYGKVRGFEEEQQMGSDQRDQPSGQSIYKRPNQVPEFEADKPRDSNLAEQLEKLAKLRADGTLSEEEFKGLKKKLIGL